MTLRWLPNAICILRLLLVVPVVLLLVEQQYAGALALIVVAGVSDALDGYLAKTFDWRSRLGGLLDPLADKLLLVSVFLALTYAGLVPLPVTAIVVGRDVVIVLGAVTYQLLIAPVEGEPTAISKLNTACQLVLRVLHHRQRRVRLAAANLAAAARRCRGVHEHCQWVELRAAVEHARLGSAPRDRLSEPPRWCSLRWNCRAPRMRGSTRSSPAATSSQPST